MKKVGNEELLERYKTAFLCSRQVPEAKYPIILDWVHQLSPEKDCILCGNHSAMEKEVFALLLQLKIPTIFVLAESFGAKWSENIESALKENRILLITSCDTTVRQVTKESAAARNQLILSLADSIVIGYCTRGGNIERQISGLSNVIILAPCPADQSLEGKALKDTLSGKYGDISFDVKDDSKAPYLRITQRKDTFLGRLRGGKICIDRSELLQFREAINQVIDFWQLAPEGEKIPGEKYVVKDIRQTYGNAYMPWDRKADEALVRLYREGKSIKALAEIFERHEGAIRARLRKLGVM